MSWPSVNHHDTPLDCSVAATLAGMLKGGMVSARPRSLAELSKTAGPAGWLPW
jgi:hypothetical protein